MQTILNGVYKSLLLICFKYVNYHMLFNIFWFSILCFSHLFANDKLLSVEMLKILIEIQNNKIKKEEDQDLGLTFTDFIFYF